MGHPLSHRDALSGFIPSGVRNRFFRGKFLDAKDLTREQTYFIERHRLHGQMIGWGVVWGLEVGLHEDDECPERWVTVKPGLAIDRLGREVAVADDEYLEVPAKEATEPSAKHPVPMPGSYFVCLRYAETGSDPVPCLDTDAYGDASRREDNCTTEWGRLEIVRADQLPAGHWRDPGREAAKTEDGERSYQDADHSIVLARITVPEPATQEQNAEDLAPIQQDEAPSPEKARGKEQKTVIDMLGRPVLTLNAQALTRIVATSWRHGGIHAAGSEELTGGDLWIEMDRPLNKYYEIDDMAFSVVAMAADGTTRRIVEDAGTSLVSVDDEHPRLVFTIPARLLTRDDPRSVLGHTILISIACEFLLDENGNPVDGDHVGSRLPTGNGVAGGRFESWFRIAPSSADDSAQSGTTADRGEKA